MKLLNSFWLIQNIAPLCKLCLTIADLIHPDRHQQFPERAGSITSSRMLQTKGAEVILTIIMFSLNSES
ncbi:hypothetical protein Mapa_017403 [Marchantia paleacea]|nr:hypothetical protein Mapa_017403 [Marchantia paleacea]